MRCLSRISLHIIYCFVLPSNNLVYLALAFGAAAAPTPSMGRPAVSLRNVTRMAFQLENRDLSGPQMGVNFPDPA